MSGLSCLSGLFFFPGKVAADIDLNGFDRISSIIIIIIVVRVITVSLTCLCVGGSNVLFR